MPRNRPDLRKAPKFIGDADTPPFTDKLLKGCDENVLDKKFEKTITDLYRGHGQKTTRTDTKKIGTTGRGKGGVLFVRTPYLWQIGKPKETCYGKWERMTEFCGKCRRKIDRPTSKPELLWSMFSSMQDHCVECEKDQRKLGDYGFEEVKG